MTNIVLLYSFNKVLLFAYFTLRVHNEYLSPFSLTFRGVTLTKQTRSTAYFTLKYIVAEMRYRSNSLENITYLQLK